MSEEPIEMLLLLVLDPTKRQEVHGLEDDGDDSALLPYRRHRCCCISSSSFWAGKILESTVNDQTPLQESGDYMNHFRHEYMYNELENIYYVNV